MDQADRHPDLINHREERTHRIAAEAFEYRVETLRQADRFDRLELAHHQIDVGILLAPIAIEQGDDGGVAQFQSRDGRGRARDRITLHQVAAELAADEVFLRRFYAFSDHQAAK